MPAFGYQPGGSQQHHRDDDHAVDAELILRRIEVQATLLDLRPDGRETLAIEVRENERPGDDAPDRPDAAEDHHAEQEDRELEVEVRRERARAVAREERSGDAAEERPDRVRPGLGPHEWNTHSGGRRLVFTDCDPRPPESRVAQPDAAEHGEEDKPHRRPEIEVVLVRLLAKHDAADRKRVDRRDPERSVRQVEAPDGVRIPERTAARSRRTQSHDREVVAAQPQGGQADHDSHCGCEKPCGDKNQPHREVDAGGDLPRGLSRGGT